MLIKANKSTYYVATLLVLYTLKLKEKIYEVTFVWWSLQVIPLKILNV